MGVEQSRDLHSLPYRLGIRPSCCRARHQFGNARCQVVAKPRGAGQIARQMYGCCQLRHHLVPSRCPVRQLVAICLPGANLVPI